MPNEKEKHVKKFKKYQEEFFASSSLASCLEILAKVDLDTIPESQIANVSEKLETFLANYPKFNLIENFNYFNSFLLILNISCFPELPTWSILMKFLWVIAFFGNIELVISEPLRKYQEYRQQYDDYRALSMTYLYYFDTKLSKTTTLNSEKTPQPKTNNLELETDLTNEEIITLISNIESMILLLPKEEEHEYFALLQNALEKYGTSLHNYQYKETTSSFDHDFKSLCIRELKEDLNNIITQINNRTLFISEEEYLSKYNHLITSFLDNIASSSDKVSMLLKLMHTLPLPNDGHIKNILKVRDDFAKCFWQTIKYCSKSEQKEIISEITPEYLPRVIIYGEYLLDNLDQTIEILNIRHELLISKEKLPPKEYLYCLTKTLTKIKGLKQKNLNTRELTL